MNIAYSEAHSQLCILEAQRIKSFRTDEEEL